MQTSRCSLYHRALQLPDRLPNFPALHALPAFDLLNSLNQVEEDI